MAWSIVEQEEKEGKDNVRIVLCKQVKFFPSEKDGEVRFIPLRFKVLKVIIQHDSSGKQHDITWSNYNGKPKFTYKWKLLNEKDDSFGPSAFWNWMNKNRGDLANQVKSAFENRMSELKIGM
jgi:hypothetical protein